MKSLLSCSFSTSLLISISSKPIFPQYIPNSNLVFLNDVKWVAVGHLVPGPEGPNGQNLNPFGLDARGTLGSNGGVPDWSVLCDLDSDEDGRTNGEELGDPNCLWRFGDDFPELEDGFVVTHPGFDDTLGVPAFSTRPPTGFIAHATLMCLAWCVLAPAGIIIAITQKTKVVSTSMMKRNWFKLHKMCLGTAVYFCLMGYVIMVNELDEFIFDNKHVQVGFAVVLLAILQPLSGFFRLHINKDGTKSKLRLVWEFQHQWTGRLIALLAVVAIYLGFKLAGDLFGYIDTTAAEALRVFVVVLFVLGCITAILYIQLFRVDERHPVVVAKEIKEVPDYKSEGQPVTEQQTTKDVTLM